MTAGQQLYAKCLPAPVSRGAVPLPPGFYLRWSQCHKRKLAAARREMLCEADIDVPYVRGRYKGAIKL